MSNAIVHDGSKMEKAAVEKYRNEIARLPVTMRPALNQQVSSWDDLFPYEQKRAAEFLQGISRIDAAGMDSLTRPLRELEIVMGVPHWNFSVERDTMQNASLLARSSYYLEWRKEVQRVFSAIEQKGREAAPPPSAAGRVVLLILPEQLPIKSIGSPKPWDPRGVEYRVSGDARRISELAMRGAYSLPERLVGKDDASGADCWLIDADAKLGGLMPAGAKVPVSLLEYAELRPFRDRFLAAVNTVPKDIAATDEILANVRQENWDRWWPATQAGQNRLRNFTIELFLSGNGALIFSNAFVQWAASEALRRARPRLVVGRFGLRSKPKPFTSIAIFENQQAINKLQEVDDPEGSAVDALILARYIWLSALRYPEQQHTSCVCVSESSNAVYVVSAEGNKPVWADRGGPTPEEVCAWMGAQIRA